MKSLSQQLPDNKSKMFLSFTDVTYAVSQNVHFVFAHNLPNCVTVWLIWRYNISSYNSSYNISSSNNAGLLNVFFDFQNPAIFTLPCIGYVITVLYLMLRRSIFD